VKSERKGWYCSTRFHNLGDQLKSTQEILSGIGLIDAGVAVSGRRGWLGNLRWRYFGPRALVENDSVRSRPANVFTAQLGYRYRRVSLKLDVFNLFDAAVSDIDYFYASRLPGEPSPGLAGVHFHPLEPRTLRFGAEVRF